jgi:glyoxylase-like metal-dependent hydrolase (beta-lactamase superfamily II)
MEVSKEQNILVLRVARRGGRLPKARVPEQVTSGVYRVDAGPYSNAISVLLIANEEGWALVDTGTLASPFRIQGALASLEAGLDELKRIYLTHHHPDHIGGLQGVLWWARQAEVVAPHLEARIISGEHPPDIPPSKFGAFIARRQPLTTQNIDRVLHEGDTFAGFRVIATPGHTLGHTSLLRDRDGLLFTGDAFGKKPFSRRIRVGVDKYICADPLEAKRSAEKLLGEEFTTVVFSHGKTMREGAKERLAEIAARER